MRHALALAAILVTSTAQATVIFNTPAMVDDHIRPRLGLAFREGDYSVGGNFVISFWDGHHDFTGTSVSGFISKDNYLSPSPTHLLDLTVRFPVPFTDLDFNFGGSLADGPDGAANNLITVETFGPHGVPVETVSGFQIAANGS